jgi:hypothetical protein
MPNSLLKIVFGAVIPSLGTWTFNLLNFFFEHPQTFAVATMPPSVYDIAVGNATAILGACMATRNRQILRSIGGAFAIVIFGILFFELLAPALFGMNKWYCVAAMDILSIFLLVWVLVEV